jgi:hypothetical protein
MILLPFPSNSFVSLSLSLSLSTRPQGGTRRLLRQSPMTKSGPRLHYEHNKLEPFAASNQQQWWWWWKLNLHLFTAGTGDPGGEKHTKDWLQSRPQSSSVFFFFFSSPCLVGPPSDLIDWSFCKELSILLYVCSFLFCKRRRIVRWRRNKSCTQIHDLVFCSFFYCEIVNQRKKKDTGNESEHTIISFSCFVFFFFCKYL